jgi:hypothetical protein
VADSRVLDLDEYLVRSQRRGALSWIGSTAPLGRAMPAARIAVSDEAMADPLTAIWSNACVTTIAAATLATAGHRLNQPWL